jgi:hypothetical protein
MEASPGMIALAVVLSSYSRILFFPGHIYRQPQRSQVMVLLFGKYAGSVRQNGFLLGQSVLQQEKNQLEGGAT